MKLSLEEIINQLTPLVEHFAQKFKMNDTINVREDLVQEGRLAICQYYNDYDETKSKPSTFFTPHIKHAMVEYVNHEVFNTTTHYTKALKKIAVAKAKLNECGIKQPTDNQIFIELNGEVALMTITQCRHIETHRKTISINSDDFTDDLYANSSLLSQSPEAAYIKKAGKENLMNAINSLNKNEKECILIKYSSGKKKSNRDVANQMGITPENVKKLINTSMKKLSKNPELVHYFPDELKNKKKVQHINEIGFGVVKTSIQTLNTMDAVMDDYIAQNKDSVVNINKNKKEPTSKKKKDNDF